MLTDLMRFSLLTGATAACLAATAAPPEEKPLSGAQIRTAISGKYVTDEHHWGHRYHADGRVERSESGRRRAGRWSVQDNKLCLLLPEISKDQPVCYGVFRHGDELEYRDERYVVYRGLIRAMPPPDPAAPKSHAP